MVYVGSAEGSEHDQVLESVMVGPVPVGVSKFILEVHCFDLGTSTQTRIDPSNGCRWTHCDFA